MHLASVFIAKAAMKKIALKIAFSHCKLSVNSATMRMGSMHAAIDKGGVCNVRCQEHPRDQEVEPPAIQVAPKEPLANQG
jgi:hypothetical protein